MALSESAKGSKLIDPKLFKRVGVKKSLYKLEKLIRYSDNKAKEYASTLNQVES